MNPSIDRLIRKQLIDDENSCENSSPTPQLDDLVKPSMIRARNKSKRRLTITSMDGPGACSPKSENDLDPDRGLIHGIDSSTLKSASPLFRGRRRWSVGTETDGHRRESFCDKQTTHKGHKFCPSASGVGYACKKGLKPVSPNQDSFMLIRIEGGMSVYGVFDGHGKVGHDVSNFCKDQIAKILFGNPDFINGSDIPAALKNAFLECQSRLERETRAGRLDASSSGTTATVVVHTVESIFVAHVGDSRCILASRNGGRVVELTMDHKPNLPGERERIIANGGVVIKPPADVNHRVYVKNQKFPGLAMSRALGDLVGYFSAGISAEPDVRVIRMESGLIPAVKRAHTESENSVDMSEFDLLLICSDGVWEFITNEECAEIAMNFPQGREMRAAEALCKESWDRWIREENGYIVDDITALVVSLNSRSRDRKSEQGRFEQAAEDTE